MDTECTPEQLAHMLRQGGTALGETIAEQGLAPLWYQRTRAEPFRQEGAAATANYLIQRHRLELFDMFMERAGIPYVALKGAANRELVYPNPAVRGSADIDLLVPFEYRFEVARHFLESGLTLRINQNVLGHEVMFHHPAFDVDLHYGLFRRGRVSENLSGSFLERRRRVAGIWVPADVDAMLLMLVHPPLVKYLAWPAMGLRLADLYQWVATRSVDWKAVSDRLAENSVKTAAWLTLHFAAMYAPSRMQPQLLEAAERFTPGTTKRRYLSWWIERDLSTQLAKHHQLRRVAFSLMLHDDMTPVYRALLGWCRDLTGVTADAVQFEVLDRDARWNRRVHLNGANGPHHQSAGRGFSDTVPPS